MTTKQFIENIKLDFSKHLQKDEERALKSLDKFLKKYHQEFLELKTKENIENGKNKGDALNSARQSWRPIVGDLLVQLVRVGIEDLAVSCDFKICEDKQLKKGGLNDELSLVRRNIEIQYDEYSLVPDGDLILYRFDKNQLKAKVLAILSFKTSFRERFTETPYWKLKLSQNKVTKDIKVVMVTTDNDDEEYMQNKIHLQNLQNNFDLVVTESSTKTFFQQLQKI